MKKLLIFSAAAIILVSGVSIAINKAYNPQPASTRVIVIKSPQKSQIAATQPTYKIGDSQTANGQTMTLEAVYAPATPFTAMDEVDSQSMLVAIQYSANFTPSREAMLIYTSDNAYIKPLGGNVKECSDNCVVFIVPKNVLVNSFIYQDFTWFL